MKDKGELTTKALLLLKTYLECGCDKKKTANRLRKNYSQVYNQLHQPYVRNIFKMRLLEKGITFYRLAKVLDEGLDAKKVVGYLNNKTQGVEKVSDEFVEVPDYPTRHKYLNTALESFEVIKYPVKVEQTNNFTSIRDSFNNLSDEELIEQARQRGISLPVDVARRIGATGEPKPD